MLRIRRSTPFNLFIPTSQRLSLRRQTALRHETFALVESGNSDVGGEEISGVPGNIEVVTLYERLLLVCLITFDFPPPV